MNNDPVTSIVGFVDEGIGHSSYLVDLGDGTALAVDPHRIPELEQAEATARGLRIAYTADTHSHADFVSGSPELVARGARFLAPATGRLVVPHHGLRDGERVDVGPFVLEAIATPGHTPDHLAYLLETPDGTRLALFSGGSLMVGTVGRTDLLGQEHAEELAHAQFHSLRDRILTLPDDLPVYPTHGAGSFCSAPGGADRTTTIGQERARNPLLQIADESTFVDALLAGFGSFPAFFRRLPEVNRRGPHVYGKVPPLARLDLDKFRAAIERDAQVVDARPIDQYRGPPHSRVIVDRAATGLRDLAGLAPRRVAAGRVRARRRPGPPRARAPVPHGRRRIPRGRTHGGFTTWAADDLPVASIALIDPAMLDGSTVLDVRQRDEFVVGHVPEARNVELGALARVDDLPAGHLTVMCGHGERAMTGASVLERAGRGDLAVLLGGPDDWATASGRALATGP